MADELEMERCWQCVQCGGLAAIASAAPERGLRIDQVCERTGLGRATIYKMVKGGDFPPARKSGEATLWLESEVSAWLRGLPRAG